LLSNYVLPTAATGAGTITVAPLTATIIGTPTKVYNGTTAATLAPANYALTGLVGTENMVVTQTTGTYNSKDVVTATIVNVTLASTDYTPNTGTLLRQLHIADCCQWRGAPLPPSCWPLR